MKFDTFRRPRSVLTTITQAGGLMDAARAYERNKVWISSVPTQYLQLLEYTNVWETSEDKVNRSLWAFCIQLMGVILEREWCFCEIRSKEAFWSEQRMNSEMGVLV